MAKNGESTASAQCIIAHRVRPKRHGEHGHNQGNDRLSHGEIESLPDDLDGLSIPI
jgi:hypothetical protein